MLLCRQVVPTRRIRHGIRTCRLSNKYVLDCQVWDIGSHVSSVNMAANYLHGCDAVLVVFDAAQKEVGNCEINTIAACCSEHN